MAITAAEINKLRKSTGAGMMDCKKALTEANGDFEQAIDILRKKGQKVSASRADRDTTEGTVFVHEEAGAATLVAIGCETDFVSRNDDFQSLGNTILNIAVAQNPADTDALLATKADDGSTVEEHLTGLMGRIGEKLQIVSYEHLTGDEVVSYVHSNGKLGVLVALTGAKGDNVKDAGRDVAMQVAAMNPVAVDKDDVDSETVEREIEIGKEQARNEGKSEDLLDRIAKGKLQRFYKDSTLLNQDFVKDPSHSVRDVLKKVDQNLTVTKFKRVSVG